MKNSIVTAPMSMYRPRFLWVIAKRLKEASYDTGSYTRWLLNTNVYTSPDTALSLDTRRDRWNIAGLLLLLIGGITLVGLLLRAAALTDAFELLWFSGALMLALPLLLAVLLPVLDFSYRLASSVSLKKLGKEYVCRTLERQVQELRKQHKFKIVAVAGSMGKTSTKAAIAEVLAGSGLRVRYQSGNYNDRVTVPLVLFDQELPGLLDIMAWRRIFKANQQMIKREYPYDIAVLEVGTDGPGQIEQFAYLKPDITVVTAIAPEHMEYFGSLEAVADEELSILPYSKTALLNADDIPVRFMPKGSFEVYGLAHKNKGYYAELEREETAGQEINLYKHGEQWTTQYISYLGTQGRKVVLAAAAVADMLGVDRSSIAAALTSLQPMPGRMQLLEGIQGATLIDDTYNATPAAVEAALAVLSNLPKTQKIAVLGSMNELGAFSSEAHRTIGASIDPNVMSLVVTIGSDARDYLAPAAEAKGCTVVSFMNPHEAGVFVKKSIQPQAVILFKGSQNGVFAEEAIKPLLLHQKDRQKLVRQSEYWMKQKRGQFDLP